MSERWLPVPGFEGSYEVSDLGRVRSLDRVVLCSGREKGTYLSRKKGRLLRPGVKGSGHLSVSFGRVAGSQQVHALVLAAFVGPRPKGTEIRHLNGMHSDNRLTNLEYSSRSRNGQDKKWHAGQSTYRLSPSQAEDILRRLKTGKLGIGVQLSREYGVAQSTISAIKHGRFHNDIRASL